MAIVINEFETVAEAPPTQPAAVQTGNEADRTGEPAALEPHELELALQLLAYRALRSWAH